MNSPAATAQHNHETRVYAMNENDLDRKDYDVDAISNYDARLEEGKKDTIFLHVLGLVATIAATIWMYSLGTGDPTQMTYLLGLPLWVSGATLIYLAMFVIGMTYIYRWKTISFEARDNAGAKKGEK